MIQTGLTVTPLTCFVGKNESGKSAIFRGLSKMNPSDGEKYDGLKEFPRRRYTIDFKKSDWPVSSVEFQLSNADVGELKKLCPQLEKVSSIICTRHYTWKLQVEFPEIILPDVSCRKFVNSLKEWLSIAQGSTAPEEKKDQFTPFKANILAGLTTRIEKTSPNSQNENIVDEGTFTNVSNFIFSQMTTRF